MHAGAAVADLRPGHGRRAILEAGRARRPAHAGRAHNVHPVAEPCPEIVDQLLAAQQCAGKAVAHPHRDWRRRRLVVHDNVEMGVERGDLVDLGQSEAHLLGQCHQMARMQAAEMVLQQVQVLDQQIAPAVAIPQQRLHVGECRRIDLPALRVIGAAPPSGAGMDAPVVMG